MNKKYAELEKMVAEYSARKKKTLEQLDKDFEENKKVLLDSSEKMRNAVSVCDWKIYKEAAEEHEAAIHLNDFIRGRKELELQGTQEEAEKANELQKQIKTECAAEANEYIANITKLLHQIAALNMAFAENCEAAENALKTWHRNVRAFKKQVGMRGNEAFMMDEIPDIGVNVGSVYRFTNEVNEYISKLDKLVY